MGLRTPDPTGDAGHPVWGGLTPVEARRLRIALLLAMGLHVLPALSMLSWPASLARASDSETLLEIETTDPGAGKTAAERAAAEALAAAEARATAAAEAREQGRIATEAGQELTPRLPTEGPVERSVGGDPSQPPAAPGEDGDGPPGGDGPGTLAAKFCAIAPGTRRIAHIVECSDGPVQHFEYLNVPARAFRDGYPGFEHTGRVEFFALFIEGDFHVGAPGEHYFRLTSDDGALLFIDDQLVVDNDGLHSAITKDGSIELGPGRHQVRVIYFQGIRYELALQLFVTPPGQSERLFSSRL